MTVTKTKPLLNEREIKDMIRSVIPHRGFDAFFDADDIRTEILNVIEVHPDGRPVTEDDVTNDDVQRVRTLVNRARVTVTFRQSR